MTTVSKEKKLQVIASDIKDNLVCPLKDAATNLVFGKGNPNASILFIGEAPGANEDKQGLPFVGAAGKNLNKLLNSINLTLDECYVANILKYRPPKNRPPQADEMERHVPYLLQQIDVIKPRVIVTLGNFSTKLVLAEFDISKMKNIVGISQLHGKIHEIKLGKESYQVIPLYHPAACIYNPKLRQTLLDDFQIINRFLSR